MSLTALRTEVKDALNSAGIAAKEYVAENIVPPICIVIPADPYIVTGEGFGEHSVGIQVLIIASKGTNRVAAEKVDSQIENVIVALDEWDITEVTQPGEVSIKGISYMAAVVSLQREINFYKEVI